METSATTIVVPPTAEEQRIASIADSINLADPSLTVTYGTEAMQGISRFADDLLSRVQAKDSGELGESLTNLMLKVKDVNVSEVMGSPGFLQSLPLVGSLFSSAKRTVAKFNTLSEQIEIIVDKLDEAMIGLLRDIETLEMLYEHNARFHAELTAYIEAGKRKLEEARTVELPRLKAQADASGDLMEAQQGRRSTVSSGGCTICNFRGPSRCRPRRRYASSRATTGRWRKKSRPAYSPPSPSGKARWSSPFPCTARRTRRRFRRPSPTRPTTCCAATRNCSSRPPSIRPARWSVPWWILKRCARCMKSSSAP